MKFIYNDLLDSLALAKQYLLSNGGIYSLSSTDLPDNLKAVKEIYDSLKTIKRGIDSSIGNVSRLKDYISDYLSIKYSSAYMSIVNELNIDGSSRTLRKVSAR